MQLNVHPHRVSLSLHCVLIAFERALYATVIAFDKNMKREGSHRDGVAVDIEDIQRSSKKGRLGVEERIAEVANGPLSAGGHEQDRTGW